MLDAHIEQDLGTAATKPKPRAYSYLRFSTPEQIAGDSYRRQTEAAQRYAMHHGLELDESLSFEDLGVSGFRGKNAASGALKKFVDLVDDGIVERGSFLLVAAGSPAVAPLTETRAIAATANSTR